MAVTDTPVFGQTPKNNTAVLTTAYDNITDDTPSNSVQLVTAGADGCLVTKIICMPRATVTATAIGLWFSPDSGTTNRLVDQVLMAAHTVATTTAVPQTNFANISETTPMRLQAGEHLYVAASVSLASGIVVYAEWTDL